VDVFEDYTREGFERAFSGWFQIEETIPVRDSSRLIYLMRKK
jgi:hypothetical protein